MVEDKLVVAVFVIADQELMAKIVRNSLRIGREAKTHLNRQLMQIGLLLAELLTECLCVSP